MSSTPRMMVTVDPSLVDAAREAAGLDPVAPAAVMRYALARLAGHDDAHARKLLRPRRGPLPRSRRAA